MHDISETCEVTEGFENELFFHWFLPSLAEYDLMYSFVKTAEPLEKESVVFSTFFMINDHEMQLFSLGFVRLSSSVNHSKVHDKFLLACCTKNKN
jgi:hypothetical protein